jgi:siroheme synthase-like protein
MTTDHMQNIGQETFEVAPAMGGSAQKASLVKEKGINPLFPVFLKLEQMQVLLVGGGKVGLEKLQALLANSPATSIIAVSETASEEFIALAAAHGNVQLELRSFREQDLLAVDILILAINDQEASRGIRNLAKERRILVNVADTPDLCDFYLGSVVRKGALKLAISTNGKSPTAAKRIREMLEQALPGELDQLIHNLHHIRNRMHGDFSQKVDRMNRITGQLVTNEHFEKERRIKRIATFSLAAFAFMLIGYFIFSYFRVEEMAKIAYTGIRSLDRQFPVMLAAGFIAQLVDGALGMGYGVTSAAILLSAGISPAAISGSIHTAEMFASGASGYSHYKFGNVNKKMVRAMLIPGVIGAIVGAVLLTYLGNTHIRFIRPILACYTLLLGVRIIFNAWKRAQGNRSFKRYGWLALAGGFLDSFGGGGWGPIVTTTLINKGRSPKYVIGSVSLTEFFVTLASAFTFFTLIGVTHWQTIVALIIGGLAAAPLAARLAGKLPKRTSFILVGTLVIIWSLKILMSIF